MFNDKASSGPGFDPATGASATHPAMDLAADMLRVFGRYAIASDLSDPEDIAGRCEEWARHILVGTPAPGRGEGVGSHVDEREWDAVKRYFTRVRRAEKEHVGGRLNDFRDMLWVFIHGLRATVVEDQAADREVAAQLDQLKQALDTESVDELRREVVASLALIGRTLATRRSRQQAQMQQLGEQLKAMRQELVSARKEMSLDPMTRLFNRASFDEMVEKSVEISFLSGQPAALVMVDIDNFKAVNDTHGHPAGDKVIMALAERLLRAFPRKGDFVARYAGDEFAVVLQDTSREQAAAVAERLLKGARDEVVVLDGGGLRYSISVGVADLEGVSSAGDWVRRADQALYQAKRTGRDRLAVFGPENA
ncbi:MAG TPA: GGDEF domain-containing protein [Gammaproteobacteria bacterium]|nr:GGDEF domain-containing protein [Gammaproteobacteria bacterium]